MSKELKKAQQKFEKTIAELEKNSYSILKRTAIEYSDYCRDVRQELMTRPMTFDEWYAAYNK